MKNRRKTRFKNLQVVCLKCTGSKMIIFDPTTGTEKISSNSRELQGANGENLYTFSWKARGDSLLCHSSDGLRIHFFQIFSLSGVNALFSYSRKFAKSVSNSLALHSHPFDEIVFSSFFVCPSDVLYNPVIMPPLYYVLCLLYWGCHQPYEGRVSSLRAAPVIESARETRWRNDLHANLFFNPVPCFCFLF